MRYDPAIITLKTQIEDGGLGHISGAVCMIGTGTATLSGLNLYAGSTIVSNGVLALSGIDSNPTNTVAVNVTAPGVLNVTGLPGSALMLGMASSSFNSSKN